MVANQKLQGWGQRCYRFADSSSKLSKPGSDMSSSAASVFAKKGPAILDTTRTNTSPGFLDPLPGCWSVVKATTADTIDLTDADGEKAFTTDRMGHRSACLGGKS
ncbi:hypothetical protein Acr_03g0006630 [Actinidia rufa]|uniref:Uncharacterized protein n=1 Tax=Actinidia rufa TaxID=165716 RepID=A0A7J0EDE8_9ERIC|nr:hypothetical protein Acr_03g0006630 [Actinidia rufa]